MTGYVFKNYVENGQETLDLALKILEKHLADKEDDDDYDELIRQKKDEIMKMQKRLFNLIEMRQDGDIERDFFVERKQLINEQIAVLDDEIAELSKPKKSDIKRDFVLRIEDLKEKLDSYIDFDTSPIPENVIEAFVEKIWVSKDEFRWYLRTSIKPTEATEHIKIGAFTLTLEDAKKYLYSFSSRRRVHNWVDINVSVWI